LLETPSKGDPIKQVILQYWQRCVL